MLHLILYKFTLLRYVKISLKFLCFSSTLVFQILVYILDSQQRLHKWRESVAVCCLKPHCSSISFNSNIKKFSGLFQLQNLLSHKVSTIPLTQISRTLWMMHQRVYLHNLGFVCLCSSAVRLFISIKRNTYNTPLSQHCWFHFGGYWWKKIP